jgi:hypothetical protein
MSAKRDEWTEGYTVRFLVGTGERECRATVRRETELPSLGEVFRIEVDEPTLFPGLIIALAELVHAINADAAKARGKI